MKHRIPLTLIFTFLSLCMPLHAGDGIAGAISHRFRMMGFYHLGAEAGVYAGDASECRLLILAGFGSHRNLLNVDIGAGYCYSTSLKGLSCDRITGHRLPLSASFAMNIFRRQMRCLHVGGEYACNIPIGAGYRTSQETVSDRKLLQSYSSLSFRVGYRWNILDLSLSCSYALSPKFDQKYIYESEAYDFEAVRTQIYDRILFGLTLRYYFPFGL